MKNFLRYSLVALLAIVVGKLSAQEATPVPYTDHIVNPDLTSTDPKGWDDEGTKKIDGSGIVKVGNAAAFDFKQTVKNLPAGKYMVTAQAAYRYGGDEQAEYDAITSGDVITKLVQLYATVGSKTTATPVQNRWDGASETNLAADGAVVVNGKYVPNSSNAVKAWFAAGKYVNELVFNLPADGDVTIGINRIGTPASDYTVIGPWTLTRLGDADPDPILTLQGTVGEQVSLTFGVYETEDEYSVDFGDGSLQTAKVGVNNAGPVDPETGQTTGATVFTGTVAGDGTIKVYGKNDIWYFLISGDAMPTTLDQPKLMNVVQMGITGTSQESVELPAYPCMTQFSFNNSPAKSVDVSKVTTLTSLNICNTSIANTDMQLESIDLSSNTSLENLVLGGTFYKKGVLKTIDLSNNTALKQIIVANQELESITLPEGATLSNGINVAMNKLTSLDLSSLAGVKTVTANDNELTSLDLSKLTETSDLYLANNQLASLTVPVSVTNLDAQNNQLKEVTIANATKSCKLENNQLTLATVPAQPAGLSTSSKTKKFTYAPQAALEVPETLTELDLTSQLTVTEGELDPSDYTSHLSGTTAFVFKTESGETLQEGTDYEVTEPGKFTFIKEQTEKIYAEMTNAALPKFMNANVFKTTAFTVTPATGINTVNAAKIQNDKFYNLQGIEVQNPDKGLFIQNGRKVFKKKW